MNEITLQPRELATVLAALRYWQREVLMSDGSELDLAAGRKPINAMTAEEIDDVMGEEGDIATDGGAFRPLDGIEIDALCERLNTAEGAEMAAEERLFVVCAQYTVPIFRHVLVRASSELEASTKAVAFHNEAHSIDFWAGAEPDTDNASEISWEVAEIVKGDRPNLIIHYDLTKAEG